MTIALSNPTQGQAGLRQAGLRQAVRAEWTKLTSLRSTTWTLAVAAVGSLLVTLLSAHGAGYHSREWYRGFDPTNQALAGLAVGPLALGVLGALVMTGEYGTGTIRSTLAAVPRRDTLLTAKVIVVGAMALVVGEVLAFASFLVGQALLASGGAPTATLGAPVVLRAVVLSGTFLALFALLGLGLGALIRHTAGAIAAFAGLTLLWPILVHTISEHLTRFAPATMFMNSVAAALPHANTVSPWVALVLMTAYSLTVLSAGAVALIRHDA